MALCRGARELPFILDLVGVVSFDFDLMPGIFGPAPNICKRRNSAFAVLNSPDDADPDPFVLSLLFIFCGVTRFVGFTSLSSSQSSALISVLVASLSLFCINR